MSGGRRRARCPTISQPPPLFDLENVTIYRGQRRVLDRFTLSIAAGQHVEVVQIDGATAVVYESEI